MLAIMATIPDIAAEIKASVMSQEGLATKDGIAPILERSGGYPQEQGKVEAYNKIVISKFQQVEELRNTNHLSIHITMKENTVE